MIGGNAIERLALSLPTDAAARRLLRKGVEYAKTHRVARDPRSARGSSIRTRRRTDADPGLPPNVDDKGGVFRGAPPKFQNG